MSDISTPQVNGGRAINSTAETAWFVAAFLLVMVAGFGLRYGTNILHHGNTFDEQYIRGPIDDLLNQGWSVKTAIDFTEAKGPGLIWPYAILGKIFGGELNDLRLITVIFFVTGVIPLLLIAQQCGVRGSRLLIVALMYVLLPHNAVLGQMMMSEPSFIFGSAWLMWAFMWGFGRSREQEHRVAGPVLCAVLLSILLHNRIHAVAFAGAIALVSFERDRLRSWPWWLACLLAGISRIPLWIRWGGLVSPAYSQMHGLGFRLDSLTYLGAVFVPFTGLLIWPALMNLRYRGTRWMVAAGAGIGLVLAIIAPASMQKTIDVHFGDTSFTTFQFLGFAASFTRAVTASPIGHHIILGFMAVVGMASLGAMAAMAWNQICREPAAIVLRLLFWTFITGWAMYAMTQGYVFDRYIMAWAALLPIVWALTLPRSILMVQTAGLIIILISLIRTWLM